MLIISSEKSIPNPSLTIKVCLSSQIQNIPLDKTVCKILILPFSRLLANCGRAILCIRQRLPIRRPARKTKHMLHRLVRRRAQPPDIRKFPRLTDRTSAKHLAIRFPSTTRCRHSSQVTVPAYHYMHSWRPRSLGRISSLFSMQRVKARIRTALP
jgi:hypothetical protein